MSLWTCRHCGTENDLNEVLTELGRIARLIENEGKRMSEIDDRLAAYATQFDDFTTDLARELADLTNAAAGNLTADQAAAFDALGQKLAAAKLQIDTADPAPATPPADGSGDGSTPPTA